MQKNAGDCAEHRRNARTNPVHALSASFTDVPEQKENPGALAGATGTDLKSFWSWFDHNLKRQIAASELVSALLNCAPEDRVPFLELLLDHLRPGWPQSLLIDLMREARWWVTNASRAERKAYCLACYEGMPEDDKRSFVAYITGARHG